MSSPVAFLLTLLDIDGVFARAKSGIETGCSSNTVAFWPRAAHPRGIDPTDGSSGWKVGLLVDEDLRS